MLKERIRRFGIDRRLKTIYDKYERFLIPGFLVGGFVVDVVTFRTLEIRTMLNLLMGYSVAVGVMLSFMHIYDARFAPSKYAVLSYARFLAPFVAQLSVGALLSAALLFYWFSGSFSVSWPLFALVSGIMISSEVFRQVYLRPTVQFGVYNFILLSYFAVLLPFVLRSLSGWIFILSGVLSTLIVLLLVLALSHFVPLLRLARTRIFVAVVSVFLIMSSFYFLKMIPPVPLSIRDAGIYHDVIRTGGEYELVGEDETFLERILPGKVMHANLADSLYAYTAIFAPAELSTVIYHHWEYKDPRTNKWVDRDWLHFTITGGRRLGYRGYTTKTGLTPGKWRVTVQNTRGQVLGRLTFTVKTPE